MPRQIDLDVLLAGCASDSFDDGIRIDTELRPLAGPGGPVKPAVYEGGNYQLDRRRAATSDAEATRVIVIDNVPSQANRLEQALRQHRESMSIPEFRLDLSGIAHLPSLRGRAASRLQRALLHRHWPVGGNVPVIFRWIGAASAALILAACTSPAPTAPTTTQEPLEFHFKWNEGEPGYEWMVNCLGGDPQPGESLEPGAIVIVDVDAAMRASGLIPGVEPTLADFEKGLRCARDD